MMKTVFLFVFVVFVWVKCEEEANGAEIFKHPKNLAWKAPEGHREKRYGGFGMPYGGYGGYGGFGMPYGGYGGYGGYPGFNYGSSSSRSWGTYSMYKAGGYSNYNSNSWGWGR